MTTPADPTITTYSQRLPEPLDPPDLRIYMEEDVPPKQSFKEILMDKRAEKNCSYYDNRVKDANNNHKEEDNIVLMKEEK